MSKKIKLEGITISDFILHYLGTSHGCIKLKHAGLKSFHNPYVIGVSNNLANKNPDFVASRELVVVIDDYGNPGTYLNPHNLMKLTELEVLKAEQQLLKEMPLSILESHNSLCQELIKVSEQVNLLQGIYGKIYDLLFYIGKMAILREIKQYANSTAKEKIKDLLPDDIQIEVMDPVMNKTLSK